MNIYVGNLSYELTKDNLQEPFASFGKVASVNIVKDRWSGNSRGFGFVEMPEVDEAQSAINGLSGKVLKGRAIRVSEARSHSEDRGRDRRGGKRSSY